MGKYVMALDAGTTSNRAILFDKRGQIISVAQKEFTQIFPQPGWVEHNANEIWSTMLGVAVEAVMKAGATPEDIEAIGIAEAKALELKAEAMAKLNEAGKLEMLLSALPASILR